MKRHLLFSVDTEPDDPLWRGLHRGNWTHENLKGLHRLAETCRRLGVRPTFFLSHSTAIHEEASRALLPLVHDGVAEVGMHLHPGDTPPLGPWDREASDNILKVPDGLLEAKFESLQWEIWSRFGRPLSYRSAAWVLDGRVVALLEKHGYVADSSVTPGVSWRLHGRPSYLEAPAGVYRLGYGDPSVPGGSGVIEVPVSVWSPRRLDAATLPGRFLGDLFTMPLGSRKGPVVRMVQAVRPPPPQWLRPAFRTLAELEATARALDGEEFLHVMCHSNEMWPGASPYVRTAAELEEFYDRLEGIFRFALERGCLPATITEYARAADASGSVAAPGAGAAATDPGREGPFASGSDGWIPSEAMGASHGGGGPGARAPSRARWTAVFAAKALVSLGALGLILSRLDLGAMKDRLREADLLMVVACLGVVMAEMAVNAAKMSGLCLPSRLRAAVIYRINLIKVLFNNLLPGGVGGEAVRTFLMGRGIGSLGAAAAAVTADRLTGLWTQALFTAASLPFLTASALPPSARWLVAGGAAVLAAGVGFVSIGPGPRLIGRALSRMPGFRDRHLQEVVRFQAFWRELSGSPARLAAAAAWCLASQCLLILILLTAVRSLGGSLSLAQASPIILFSALSGLIPLSLGGLGVAEGAMALAFAAAGSQAELGLLASLVIRMTQVPLALSGGYFFVRGGFFRAKAPAQARDFSIPAHGQVVNPGIK